MAHDRIERTTVKERLTNWSKRNKPNGGLIETAEVDFAPEAELLDKARVKLLNKPSNKKSAKSWIIEIKWNSEADYLKYTGQFWRERYPFRDDWHSEYRWPKKFSTLQGAQNHCRTLRPSIIFDSVSGRDLRIRNIQTGEIRLFNKNQ